MNAFSIIIGVGPSQADIQRTADLLDAIRTWEPQTPLVVLIDDVIGGKRQLDIILSHVKGPRLVSIENPRRGRGIGETSGLAAGMLAALAWIDKNESSEFVLKLDTDALVIAPFVDQIEQAMQASRDVGMFGLYDQHCDGTPRDQTAFKKMLGKLAAPAGIWRNPVSPTGYLSVHLWGRGAVIRGQIREAIQKGYQPAEFILGGAYVLTNKAVRRMKAEGLFSDPELWLHTHFSEDVVLSMYTCLVGLKLAGYCAPGEAFGVQHSGLPASPEELLEKGYSIIHSLKSDKQHSEQELREFFRAKRHDVASLNP